MSVYDHDPIKRIPSNQATLSMQSLKDAKHGIESGVASFTFPNGDKYVGNWQNYKMNGFGLCIYNNK